MKYNIDIVLAILCGLTTAVFSLFKLYGFLDWSWLWVLAPVWIPIGLLILAIYVVGILSKLL